MKPDNATLNKALSVNEQQLQATQGMIIANSTAIQDSGKAVASPAVAAKVFLSIAGALMASGKNPVKDTREFEETLSQAGINWLFPDAATLSGNFTNTEAWRDRMEGWGTGYSELIGNTVKEGLSKGWSPLRTAREMRKYAEGIPLNAAENITRTLQLTSYIEASAATELMNGAYIERAVRIATLDDRCCLSCISLHGTEVPVGEPVSDHYRGRCDKILIPIGGEMPEFMQADSPSGGRNLVPFQTGEEWFAGLPEERQARQASFLKSPAKLNAYKSGISLSGFVGHHEDSIFGDMVVENSLVKSLGDEAEQYYKRKESKDES
jgi:hypothetical protein